MRRHALLLAVVLSGAGLAQEQLPLPDFARTYSGMQTRGFWFQAPIDFEITALRVPDEGRRFVQVVEVVDLGVAAPPVWPATGTGTQLFYANGRPAEDWIDCTVWCRAGRYYGVLGACGTAAAPLANSYGNGPFVSNVLGHAVTLTRFGTQFNIAATGGHDPFWQDPAFEIGRVEVRVRAVNAIPLPPYVWNYTAQLTRGFWFRAPMDFRVRGLRVPDESLQGQQVVELIDFGLSPPPPSSAPAPGTQLFYSSGQPSSTVVPCDVECLQGRYYGVLGACGTAATPLAHSYAPSWTFASSLLGNAITLTRLGTQFNIAATGGNGPCFTENAGSIARVEVYVAPPPQLPLPGFDSTYINNAQTRGYWFRAPIDFTITGLRVPDEGANGTQVVEVIDLGVSPPPDWPNTMTGTQRFFATGVPSATVIPCAIGCVRNRVYGVLGACITGSGAMASSYAPPGPFATRLFDMPIELVRLGTQFNLATTGGHDPVWQEPAGSIARIELYARMYPRYAMAVPFGQGCTGGTVLQPLVLTVDPRPVLGTTVGLFTTNVPAGTIATVSRLTNPRQLPPIDLGVFGAPECFAHVGMAGPDNMFLFGGPTVARSLTIPLNWSYVGTVLHSQSASLVPGANPLGIVTSNGMRLVVDAQ